MEKEFEKKRRLFLSQACLPVLASVLGILLVTGCTVGSDEEEDLDEFESLLDEEKDLNSGSENTENQEDDEHEEEEEEEEDDEEEDDDEDDDEEEDEDEDEDQNGNSNNATSTIVIDLTATEFKDLENIGGWMNYTAKNLLLVRVSETSIRLFNNACPHEGVRNRWSFDGSKFLCSEHNRSYSNTCNGSLICYNSILEGNILTISVAN
ncbi:MAG: Rieske 2Fe-2S domain-containing protein [Bacteroidetes bacterium]|nr:Rieske 2Fe-2S domain-containing protein [Bacteroidota bacterium]